MQVKRDSVSIIIASIHAQRTMYPLLFLLCASDSRGCLPLERTVLEESTSVSHSGQTVVSAVNGDEAKLFLSYNVATTSCIK